MCKYQSQRDLSEKSTEQDHKHKVCGHVRSIVALKTLQWIGLLVVISSGCTVIDTKRSKSNFIVKSLYVDDLLIAENGVESLSKAKGIVII